MERDNGSSDSYRQYADYFEKRLSEKDELNRTVQEKGSELRKIKSESEELTAKLEETTSRLKDTLAESDDVEYLIVQYEGFIGESIAIEDKRSTLRDHFDQERKELNQCLDQLVSERAAHEELVRKELDAELSQRRQQLKEAELIAETNFERVKNEVESKTRELNEKLQAAAEQFATTRDAEHRRWQELLQVEENKLLAIKKGNQQLIKETKKSNFMELEALNREIEKTKKEIEILKPQAVVSPKRRRVTFNEEVQVMSSLVEADKSLGVTYSGVPALGTATKSGSVFTNFVVNFATTSSQYLQGFYTSTDKQ
ncbi:hypothetical protein HDE_12129 [Halotydeus destructor]|nr:hypothetical protein HDE_12129 [Halotydeus destructor]